MTCDDYQPLLSGYLDRELRAEDTKEVGRHLGECSSCREEFKTLVQLKEALRSQSLPGIPADLVAEIEAQTIDRPIPVSAGFFRMLRWSPVAIAAAVGAWLLLRSHAQVTGGVPAQVVQQPAPVLMSTHTLVVKQACEDMPRGC